MKPHEYPDDMHPEMLLNLLAAADGEKPRSMYYDRSGRPVEMLRWARGVEGNRRHVGVTYLSNRYKVSTVWMGLDHSHGFGLPLIFETMVFSREKVRQRTKYNRTPKRVLSVHWREEDADRYTTESQALAGHRAMVEKYHGRRPR